MEPISLPTAFSAGLLSFISPCVLPLVPVYLASLSGPEILETTSPRRRLTIFLHSLSFVVGFSLVFAILGAGAGIAGITIGAHINAIRQVTGSLLIAFGVFIIASQWIPRLNFQKQLSLPRSMTIGYFRSLFTGATFFLACGPPVSARCWGESWL